MAPKTPLEETNSGVTWEQVTLDTLESNEGLLLKDELAAAILSLAEKIVDEKRTGKGKLVVTIAMVRNGDMGLVNLGVDVVSTEPKVVRRSITAMRNRAGKLVAQEHKQERLPLAEVRSLNKEVTDAG
jgi:hypothetical protein